MNRSEQVGGKRKIEKVILALVNNDHTTFDYSIMKRLSFYEHFMTRRSIEDFIKENEIKDVDYGDFYYLLNASMNLAIDAGEKPDRLFTKTMKRIFYGRHQVANLYGVETLREAYRMIREAKGLSE
ncbi:hypothetical protein ATI02_4326 [Pseudomonas baetica]|uniref:Uncharacterized protein n=1 Tax=Pseudomonas baetica TaxID=674054 RepID=A0ABX4Q3I3_9PSED|nr:hypothetical protein [Pseudomonas baetica]PKA71348.1 hypothetical protein ATI02_4326 [Pseudomonas baetica]PTC19847.1 hypothetical protein C0J26_07570 [Pseudomonas baetica]